MKRADGSEVKEAVYIGLCKHGTARAIIVDDARYLNETADFVAKMVREGLTVQRVSGAEGREAIRFECVPCDERLKKSRGSRAEATSDASATR